MTRFCQCRVFRAPFTALLLISSRISCHVVICGGELLQKHGVSQKKGLCLHSMPKGKPKISLCSLVEEIIGVQYE
jgi:hypothetical protein